MFFEDAREIERNSKDEHCNMKGRRMLRWMAEEGMMVLNGWSVGDELGEYTYIGKETSTVVDIRITACNFLHIFALNKLFYT